MRKIGELLVQEGLVLAFHVERALFWQHDDGGRIGSLLIRLGYLDEREFLRLMAAQLHTRPILIGGADLNPELIPLVPADVARQANAVPIAIHGEQLVVATSDPHNVHALREIEAVTGRRVEAWLATDPAVATALDRYYPRPELADATVGAHGIETAQLTPGLAGVAESSPEGQLQTWIARALACGASGLAIEMSPGGLRVRAESVDGGFEIARPATSLYKTLLQCVRIAASLRPPTGAARRESGVLPYVHQHQRLKLGVVLIPDVYGYAVRIALHEARGRLMELGPQSPGSAAAGGERLAS